jgi:hypothetical protein
MVNIERIDTAWVNGRWEVVGLLVTNPTGLLARDLRDVPIGRLSAHVSQWPAPGTGPGAVTARSVGWA